MNPELRAAVEIVAEAIRRRAATAAVPLVVAIDGRSGSGKSTVASLLALIVDASVVPTDDFFAADVPAAEWDALTPVERASEAINWRRVRAEALEPLRSRRSARWRAFDFTAGPCPDGTYAMQHGFTERSPKPVIILDGMYSARPELRDLIDLDVLVEAPTDVRHQRLRDREEAPFLVQWHARWDEAEEYYFEHVRPRATFDFVVSLGSLDPTGPRYAG